MGQLDNDTRIQLLLALQNVPLIADGSGRSLLLHGLPGQLRGRIEKSAAPFIDLANIVDACDLWMPDASTADPYPLRLLILNALVIAGEGAAAPPLQAVLEELPRSIDLNDQLQMRRSCPYPGMIAFSTAQERFFYGRQEDSENLAQRLFRQNYLVVLGPSGSGKSSLIFAGLVPLLNDARVPGTTGPWQVLTMRPGADPMARLAALFGADAPNALALRLQQLGPGHRILLVIDQAEELFARAGRVEQRMFALTLRTMLRQLGFTLVLTMRSDFYSDLMTSELRPADPERFDIAPLHGEALRPVIVDPAANAGVEIDAALVERLIADAAREPGSLPLLQETLVRLWTMCDGRTLPLSAYTRFARGERSGLGVAIALVADATLAPLPKDQQDLVRRIFLRLVEFNPGRAPTRRQQPVAELLAPTDDPELFRQTLSALVDSRLLTISSDLVQPEQQLVDLAHEIIITGWPILAGWIKQWQANEETRRRLEALAAEWERHNGEGFVFSGEILAENERWLRKPEVAALGPSEALRKFLAASREAAVAAQQQEATIAEQEKQKQFWLRTTLGVVVAALAGAATAKDMIDAEHAQAAQAHAEASDAHFELYLTKVQVAHEHDEMAKTLNGLVPGLGTFIVHGTTTTTVEAPAHDDHAADPGQQFVAFIIENPDAWHGAGPTPGAVAPGIAPAAAPASHGEAASLAHGAAVHAGSDHQSANHGSSHAGVTHDHYGANAGHSAVNTHDQHGGNAGHSSHSGDTDDHHGGNSNHTAMHTSGDASAAATEHIHVTSQPEAGGSIEGHAPNQSNDDGSPWHDAVWHPTGGEAAHEVEGQADAIHGDYPASDQAGMEAGQSDDSFADDSYNAEYGVDDWYSSDTHGHYHTSGDDTSFEDHSAAGGHLPPHT